ncbi:MAG: hypothetical protein GWN00_31370, partial [Aliifodinibius sp.]|nr:hypothetical protein [Fodinibius sp.]NIV15250.1 hypothetical protein [Fodinibius sp.]NIY29124.1 hypothetical protein [Fodinibius sp.]
MLNPTDQAVDSFYNSLLANHPTQQFDVIREGRAPHVFDFAPYELILWHHEVLYPTVIDQSQSELQAYLDAGGKVILSGMNFLDHLNADFAATFLGFGNPLLNSSADFLG